MQKEIWKDIEGYEGLYQVSNFGRVKSLDRYIPHSLGGNAFVKEKVLSCESKKYRYKRVSLYSDGGSTGCLIHRLVAKAFIPNPENKPYVNHLDGNRLNNKASNLEWCTAKENTHHAIENGLQRVKGEFQTNSKFTPKDILDIRKMLDEGRTSRSIAEDYDVHESTISLIKIGKHWSHIQEPYRVRKLNPKGGNPLDGVRILPSRFKNYRKLKPIDIINIRLLYKNGVRQRDLINYYNTSKTSMNEICLNKTWTHIIV